MIRRVCEFKHPEPRPDVCGVCRVATTTHAELYGYRTMPALHAAVCEHLGRPVGDVVKLNCAASPPVRLPLLACAVHGSCTEAVPGREVKCCRYCSDSSPLLTLNMGAGGLGDAVQGMGVVHGMGRRVRYRVSARTIPFVRLFLDDVVEHELDRDGVLRTSSKDRQLNARYREEGSEDGWEPRWVRYMRNVGCEEYKIPQLRDPTSVLRAGADHAGKVALCPFSSGSDREYTRENWLELERQLLLKGYEVVVVHSHPERTEFRSPEVIGESPERVAGVLLNAACVVGIDSGLSHLAGALGRPTVVLCGPTRGELIFGCYPTVRSIQGRLPCDGCYWNSPPRTDKCLPLCPSIQTIDQRRVIAEVDRLVLPGVAGDRSLVGPDRLAVIRDLSLETRRVRGDVAELGVYAGGTARLLRKYNQGRLVLFDTFEGIPEDDQHGRHVRGEFAWSLEEVRSLVGEEDVEYRVGKFPGTAPDDDRQFRLVHLDGDTYQTTAAGLDWFAPRMGRGGAIVLDDYGWEDCPGVRRAVHERFDAGRVETPARHQCVLRF